MTGRSDNETSCGTTWTRKRKLSRVMPPLSMRLRLLSLRRAQIEVPLSRVLVSASVRLPESFRAVAPSAPVDLVLPTSICVDVVEFRPRWQQFVKLPVLTWSLILPILLQAPALRQSSEDRQSNAAVREATNPHKLRSISSHDCESQKPLRYSKALFDFAPRH